VAETKMAIRSPGQALRVAASAIAAALVASACAAIPSGNSPTVAMLPGGGKSMHAFNIDDIACRDTAKAKAAMSTPLPVAMGLGKSGEVVAANSSRPALRDPNESTGSVYGNATAADAGSVTPQQRYDTAYVQCMSAKGHTITVGEASSS